MHIKLCEIIFFLLSKFTQKKHNKSEHSLNSALQKLLGKQYNQRLMNL